MFLHGALGDDVRKQAAPARLVRKSNSESTPFKPGIGSKADSGVQICLVSYLRRSCSAIALPAQFFEMPLPLAAVILF
jgi:hypothetical protein